MPDIDLLGPGDAGAARALPSTDPTVTAAIAHPDALDTYFGDCVANVPGTGTPIVSKFLNRLLQQTRRLIRLSGIPLSNATDDMLGLAIQAGSLNWIGTFGGSANALTATLTPSPSLLLPNLRVAGLVAATNNGPTTLTVGGITLPATLVDGTPMIGGELTIGEFACFTAVGAGSVSSWAMTSPLPLSFLNARYVPYIPATTYYINNAAANASGDTTGNGLTPATAWFSLAHAISAISAYYLNNQTVTIQLALSGVSYAAPGAFTAPNSGTLLIRGDPTAQANYVISSGGVAGAAVVAPVGGSTNFNGVTLQNTGTISGILLAQGGKVNLQNTTVVTTVLSTFSLAQAITGGSLALGAGNIWSGSANSVLAASVDGTVTQLANQTVGGATPTYSLGFVAASQGGVIIVAAGTWTGAANGPEYSATYGGGVASNGITFPHSTAGVATAPGWHS